MLLRPLSRIRSLLAGMIVVSAGAQMNPHRIYGPRVYTSKDMGRTSEKHLRSKRYPAITAEEAPHKRECIRRRRQALRIEAKDFLADSLRAKHEIARAETAGGTA